MLRTTSLRKVLLIGLLTFLITSQASTVTAGTNIWTSNGPEGGMVYALAIDPTTPSTVYAGTYYGGVFKSTNGGGAWSAVNTGLSSYSVSALAIDPTTPSTLYAGTPWFGGVDKSTNGGGNWSATLVGAGVSALAIDPATPSTLYAGIDYGGVFKSTDGGGNWSEVNTGLPNNTTVYALAIDPTTPSTLYAGGPSGVFKSTDSGGNWGAVITGLTVTYVYALAIDPTTPSTLYAGTLGFGVFKSTNGGGNWSAVNAGLTSTGTTVFFLAIDPKTPSTLYAGTFYGGVFKSTNGGEAWSRVSTGLINPDIHTDVLALAIDPTTPSTLYAGTWTGADGGGVFAIQQIQVPALAINYSGGAPGSYFTITGSNYPPNSTATITINGNILGTVPTNSSGGFIFLLETSLTAEEGFYSVTVSINPSAMTQFTLDAEDDVRPQEGSGTVFVVPDGIAFHAVYLPLIVR